MYQKFIEQIRQTEKLTKITQGWEQQHKDKRWQLTKIIWNSFGTTMKTRWKRKLPQCLFPMEHFPEPSYFFEKLHFLRVCCFNFRSNTSNQPVSFPWLPSIFPNFMGKSTLFLLVVLGISRMSLKLCVFLGSFIVSIFIIASLYCFSRNFQRIQIICRCCQCRIFLKDPMLVHHFIYMDELLCKHVMFLKNKSFSSKFCVIHRSLFYNFPLVLCSLFCLRFVFQTPVFTINFQRMCFHVPKWSFKRSWTFISLVPEHSSTRIFLSSEIGF